MGELTSATIAPPGAEDPVWGSEGAEAILYLDLCCPRCAVSWARARELPLRLHLRHFPIASKRPRAPALHAAAEAAGLQDHFAEMWDLILLDTSHVDDPHLWARAEKLGLDLEQFDRDRRSSEVSARVRAEFERAIRGGITGTPAAVIDGAVLVSGVEEALTALAGR